MDARVGDNIIQDIRLRAGKAKRIVFVSGNFNVLHPGHLRLLKFAAELGEFVVVGINANSTMGVTIPARLRMEGVRAVSLVDYAVLLEEPAEQFIAKLKPDFVVKGKEHETRHNPERAVVESYGGKLVFGSGEVTFSSIDLLRREYFQLNLSSIIKPTDYPARHDFEIGKLRDVVAKFSGMRVLVIGDLIVDEYIECDPLGMSQEDPTIVLTPINASFFIGGAGIVAAHARALGAEVYFTTVIGEDDAGKYARESLAACDVKAQIFVDSTRPTTRKQRFRAHNKTLLRVNHLRQHAIESDLIGRIFGTVGKQLPRTDIILFADFNYGCLPQPLVEAITKSASSAGVMMTADSQASSQYADISRFKDMCLITPTEREARLALRDFESGPVLIAEQLRHRARAASVILTLGPEGVLVYAKKDGEYRIDRLPAFNTVAKDPAGAGDCFFACASLALCTGADIWQSAYLGSLAAACQVGRVGNIPLHAEDLVKEIDYPVGWSVETREHQ